MAIQLIEAGRNPRGLGRGSRPHLVNSISKARCRDEFAETKGCSSYREIPYRYAR